MVRKRQVLVQKEMKFYPGEEVEMYIIIEASTKNITIIVVMDLDIKFY